MTSRLRRKRLCFNREVLLLRFLFLILTWKPCMQVFWGMKGDLFNIFITCSRATSKSNGSSFSFRFRPSNSIGPNKNGLPILALSADSNPVLFWRSKYSSLTRTGVFGASLLRSTSATSSTSFPPFFPGFPFAFAFFAASRAYTFFSSTLL